MKILKILLGMLFLGLMIASCHKEWTCQCVSNTYHIYEHETVTGKNHKTGKANCEQIEQNYQDSIPDMSCELL